MARVDNTGGSGFNVDNGTGLVVRTKLNQIIAALSTLSQGSGTPTIGLSAYTPFIDGNTLKIQNAQITPFTLGDVSQTNFGHADSVGLLLQVMLNYQINLTCDLVKQHLMEVIM